MSGSLCLNLSKISCIGRLWYRPSPLWTDERGQALSGARCRLFREQRPDGEVEDVFALPPRDRYAQDEMPRGGAELGPQHRGDLIGDVGLDDSAMVNDALRAICGPEGRPDAVGRPLETQVDRRHVALAEFRIIAGRARPGHTVDTAEDEIGVRHERGW